MTFDYILSYTGHTEDGKLVHGYTLFELANEFVVENGDFSSCELKEAIDRIEYEASATLQKRVFCDKITLTAMREDGKVVVEFPYGMGKTMYDSGWRDPRYIGAVKP